jgi:hypothetical protein
MIGFAGIYDKFDAAFLLILISNAIALGVRKFCPGFEMPIEPILMHHAKKPHFLFQVFSPEISYNYELYFGSKTSVIIYTSFFSALLILCFVIYNPLAPLLIIYVWMVFVINASVKDTYVNEFQCKSLYRMLGIHYRTYIFNKIKFLSILDMPFLLVLIIKCMSSLGFAEMVIGISYTIFVIYFMPIVYSCIWLKLRSKQELKHTVLDYAVVIAQFLYPLIALFIFRLYKIGEREWIENVGY